MSWIKLVEYFNFGVINSKSFESYTTFFQNTSFITLKFIKMQLVVELRSSFYSFRPHRTHLSRLERDHLPNGSGQCARRSTIQEPAPALRCGSTAHRGPVLPQAYVARYLEEKSSGKLEQSACFGAESRTPNKSQFFLLLFTVFCFLCSLHCTCTLVDGAVGSWGLGAHAAGGRSSSLAVGGSIWPSTVMCQGPLTLGTWSCQPVSVPFGIR
jgi:hypothetical protein